MKTIDYSLSRFFLSIIAASTTSAIRCCCCGRWEFSAELRVPLFGGGDGGKAVKSDFVLAKKIEII